MQIRNLGIFQAILSLNFKRSCWYFSLFIICMLMLQVAPAQINFGEVDQVLTARTKYLGGKVVALVSKDGEVIYKKEIGEDFKSETAEPI